MNKRFYIYKFSDERLSKKKKKMKHRTELKHLVQNSNLQIIISKKYPIEQKPIVLFFIRPKKNPNTKKIITIVEFFIAQQSACETTIIKMMRNMYRERLRNRKYTKETEGNLISWLIIRIEMALW